jgi:hypothetical protein
MRAAGSRGSASLENLVLAVASEQAQLIFHPHEIDDAAAAISGVRPCIVTGNSQPDQLVVVRRMLEIDRARLRANLWSRDRTSEGSGSVRTEGMN